MDRLKLALSKEREATLTWMCTAFRSRCRFSVTAAASRGVGLLRGTVREVAEVFVLDLLVGVGGEFGTQRLIPNTVIEIALY